MSKICVFDGMNLSRTRMLQLSKWAKRFASFGAEIHVTEVSADKFDVKLYQEKTRVDKNGNRYISNAKDS